MDTTWADWLSNQQALYREAKGVRDGRDSSDADGSTAAAVAAATPGRAAAALRSRGFRVSIRLQLSERCVISVRNNKTAGRLTHQKLTEGKRRSKAVENLLNQIPHW